MVVRRIAAIVGQSNELGAGPTRDFTPAWGYPLRDPIAPNGPPSGNGRSMWPYLSDLLGRRGSILSVWNSAVGATSIVESWAGGCRAWASSMVLTRGSYSTNAGNLYKCDACVGFALTSTIAPTGATNLVTNEAAPAGTWSGASGANTLTYSTTLPGSVLGGMGISGDAGIPAGARISNVTSTTVQLFTSAGAPLNLTGPVTAATLTIGTPWLYVGAAQAGDTNGAVYTVGSPRFDPNGYIANAYAGLSGAPAGFDEKWVFMSIGQGDKTVGTVAARYSAGLQSVANYFLARGVKVALGFTCSAATAGTEAWYQSDLLPGYASALASYTGNPNVKAGANLRSALGVLPVAPTSGSGLQADQLHMNDAAYLMASEAWHDALVAAGW